MIRNLVVAVALAAVGCSNGSSSGSGGGSAGGGAGGGATGGGVGGGGGSGGGSGGGNATCSATTCPTGCCSATGTCETGDTTAACGTAGATCAQCAGTFQCSNGVCFDPAACNATTCGTGCCLSDGGCNTNLTFNACGVGGAACVACPGVQNCLSTGVCANVKKMFLSSQRITGNFGGLTAADDICIDSAADAGLGGDWVAYVGDSTASPRSRLPDAGPWYLGRTFRKMFDSKADIDNLMEPNYLPALTEYGYVVNTSLQEMDVYVWTGDGSSTCVGWTTQTPGNNGRCGNARLASSWSSGTLCGCEEQRRLYCFEK